MIKLLKEIKSYLKESWSELKKVTWLSLEDTIKITSNVLVFSIIFLIFFSIIEIIFLGIVLIK